MDHELYSCNIFQQGFLWSMIWPSYATLISTETLQNMNYARANSLTWKFYTSMKPLLLVRKAKNAKYMAKVSLIPGGL
jgi:hypothetical protein